MARIDPLADLGCELIGVEKPGRYVGGEYGTIAPDTTAPIRVAVAFPDTYEIGMSNLAVRLLYGLCNAVRGVSCERVFMPATDFSEVLRRRSISLYSLESGTELSDFDVIALSVGYELSATNVLGLLELGGVPIHNEKRTDRDPIVLAGGPALTNPRPWEAFIDGIFIGEAECELPRSLEKLVGAKTRGADRSALLEILHRNASVWYAGRETFVMRSVWTDFSDVEQLPPMPVPSIGTVQDHGVVEVMRGCPNGCRFCHAGVFYRPWREKRLDIIVAEVESQVHSCGYREITLSSLSSGDYSLVRQLTRVLNDRFKDQRVSFSLPSLRVDSFTLPLLSEISATRKSGLTFAVETPNAQRQRGINKTVSAGKIIDIMREAKGLGWRLAKFYFMLGLPVACGEDESAEIADFVSEVQAGSGMSLNVNVNTFVPKPHTPFQWAGQLKPTVAEERMRRVKKLVRNGRIAVKTNDAFSSLLEGLIARGDASVGRLIETAYREGAAFDAWHDQLNRPAWTRAIDVVGPKLIDATLGEKDPDAELPWRGVKLGVSNAFLKRELSRAMSGELTPVCSNSCPVPCGVCGGDVKVVRAGDARRETSRVASIEDDSAASDAGPDTRRYVLFRYEKKDRAVYLSHLNVMSVFERAFLRAGVRVAFTRGFNPKPRLEFAHPLTLGFSSASEIARVEVEQTIDDPDFVERMNRSLPAGIVVTRALCFESAAGGKPASLMSRYWGSLYRVSLRSPGSSGRGILSNENAGGEAGNVSEECLKKYIERYVKEFALKDAVDIVRSDSEDTGARAHSVTVRARQSGKQTNIFRMLKHVSDSYTGVETSWVSPGCFQVDRLVSYAVDADGRPESFFENPSATKSSQRDLADPSGPTFS